MSASDFNQPLVQKYLQNKEIAVLATVNGDGLPLATPMWFVSDEQGFAMVSHAGMRKMKNIEINPKVSVTVESGSGTRIECVIVQGGAQVVSEPSARAKLGEMFVSKYGPSIEERWGGRSVPDSRVLFRITPTRVLLWGTLAAS